MSKIKIDGLTKKFGAEIANDNLTFTIEDGEFLVIVGPSGCGKSTLLRQIAGLEEPDEGKIFFDEKLINDVPPDKRNVAMVFQYFALYPHMSVFDNISLCLKIRGYSKEDVKKKVDEISKKLKIHGMLHKKPTHLSSGQQQRVALARALVRDPIVFLLDEPLANLDAKLKDEMRAEFQSLHGKFKITKIYVTHDQFEAMSLGDRIAVMDKGKMIQIGKPEEIYHHPANVTVADFIGSPPMNLIECHVVESGRRYWLESENLKIKISEEILKRLRSTTALLGIRPEFIRMKEGGPVLKNVVVMKGEISIVEKVGVANAILHVKAGKDVIRVLTKFDKTINVNQSYEFVFDEDKILIFDKITQNRIK